ncbi:hypothetical protein COP1_044738 [Malus domestica]
MKSGKVDSAAKVALKPAPFAAEIDSPQIQNLKLAISELRFAAYAKKGVDELQRVRVSLLKKNEQLKVGEVSAQTGAARGEAPDDAAAKSVTAVEGCSVLGRGEAYRLRSMSSVDKTSAALLLEGQAVSSLPESVGYLSALDSSFRIPGQPSIECTAGGIITFAAYSAELVQTFPDEIHLFECFGLPIALKISRHGHKLLDAIFLEELRQIFAHELQAVVGDDGLRDAKSVNDVPPYEALYVLGCAVDMRMLEISIEGICPTKVCSTTFGASLGYSVALSRLGVKARQEAVELGPCYM